MVFFFLPVAGEEVVVVVCRGWSGVGGGLVVFRGGVSVLLSMMH